MVIGTTIMLLAGGSAALRDPAFYALALAMLAWNLGEALTLKQEEPSDYAHKRNTRLLQAAVMVSALVGALDRWRLHWTPLPAWTLWAGVATILAGGALRVWAIRTLDRHFTYELRVKAGQEVVRAGPYRVVRHPSYAGLLLVALGEGVLLGSALGILAGAAAVLAMLVLRIRAEEQVLRASFGRPYEEYAAETWRLVPFVY